MEWERNKTTKDMHYYVEKTSIRPSRLKYYIRKLKQGVNIDKSIVKKGRHRKLGYNESHKLVSIIRENNRSSLRAMQKMLVDDGCPVSVATIHTHLRRRMTEYDFPIFTLKRFVTRDIRAEQDISLKQKRKDILYELNNYISRGFRPLYIDESHWDLGIIAGRARSEIGTTLNMLFS